MPVKQHLKTYGQSTSIKGLAKFVKSTSLCLKILWFLAFAVGLGAGLYQITTIMMKYFSYSSVTKISDCSYCHPPFPDITLCNSNPLGIFEMFHIEKPGEVMTFTEFRNLLMDFSAHGPSSEQLQQKYKVTDDQLGDMFDELYTFRGYFHNVNITTVYDLMVTLKDKYKGLVNHCNWFDWENREFGNEDCRLESKYFIDSSHYFVCTTIHKNETNPKPGGERLKALGAVLYLNRFTDIFMPSYNDHILASQASGVRVIIHPPNTYPDPAKGFNIPPGHEVEIKLKAIKITRLPPPYSTCSDEVDLVDVTDNDVRSSAYSVNLTYSREAATAICKQEYYVKKCSCFHPSFPSTMALMEKYPNVYSCLKSQYIKTGATYDQLNETQLMHNIKCFMFDDSDSDGQSLDETCSREVKCNDYDYDYIVQQSPWPDEIYMLQFYCNYIDKYHCEQENGSTAHDEFFQHFDQYKPIYLESKNDENAAYMDLRNLTSNENLIGRNFIQLKVLFPDSGELQYTDVPSITVDSLFGSLGGLLNLWIGFTFFTLIEWTDLLVIIVFDCLNKRKKVSDDSEKTTPTKNEETVNNEKKLSANGAWLT